MNAMDAILSRRSVRTYEDRPVPEEAVRALLDVLFSSPTAADARPWHFVVVDRKEILERLGRDMEHCEMLQQARLGLLICADPSLEKIPGFWPQDCAAAAENALVAVNALGLGGVWVALYPLEDRMGSVRKALEIPANIMPFALLSIGFPAEFPGRQDRYDAKRVHRNGW